MESVTEWKHKLTNRMDSPWRVVSLLLVTSIIGSFFGLLVFYIEISREKHAIRHVHGMNIGMLNSMSFAYIFAMLVELVTNSKILAIILPLIAINIATITRPEAFKWLELLESNFSALMSTTMSIMLIGMIRPNVIWVIQAILDLIQFALLLAAIRSRYGSTIPHA